MSRSVETGISQERADITFLMKNIEFALVLITLAMKEAVKLIKGRIARLESD